MLAIPAPREWPTIVNLFTPVEASVALWKNYHYNNNV